MNKYQMPTKKKIPFEIVGNDYCIWKLPNKLISCTKKLQICPVCGSPLNDGYTLIPVSTEKKAKISGRCCSHCESIYTTDGYFAELILHDNVYAKKFSLDGIALWNISEVKKEKRQEERNKRKFEQLLKKLQSVPFSEVMICVKYSTGKADEIIIVNNSAAVDSQKNIFHYSSEEGREFLSAAYAEKRNRCGSYNGETYCIVGRPLYRTAKAKSLSENIIPVELTIQAEGGYISSIKNKNYELVDLLLYSAYTDKYEIIKATHDKKQNICFVDISKYRNFVHEYGDPGLIPIFKTNRSSSYGYDDLKAESILKVYGYTVNEKDNLSSHYRQELLSEIIDLNIMSASQIVRFLKFLIQSRPHQPIAQGKWANDKRFVENYKVNPERFLLAKQK